MSKKLSLIIPVLILPLFFSGCFHKQTSDNEQPKEEQEKKIRGSLESLVAEGKPVQCRYEGQNEQTTFQGETYVSGNKIRQDIAEEVGGDKMEIHMIIDNQQAYVWNSTQPSEGIKMTINKNEEKIKESDNTGEVPRQFDDWKTEYDFSCQSWQVDNTKFDLPADVTFRDTSTIFDNINAEIGDLGDFNQEATSGEINNGDLKETACQACDNLPDSTACRASVGCE